MTKRKSYSGINSSDRPLKIRPRCVPWDNLEKKIELAIKDHWQKSVEEKKSEKNLDKLAGFIIAPTARDCCAICVVDRDVIVAHNGTGLPTSIRKKIENENILKIVEVINKIFGKPPKKRQNRSKGTTKNQEESNSILSLIEKRGYNIIAPGVGATSGNNEQYHCEMRILYYLTGAQRSEFYIGISKPCCLRCGMVIHLLSGKTRGCSGGLWSAGWIIPSFISDNLDTDAFLRGFIGDKAAEYYYQTGNKIDRLKSLIQNMV